MFEMAARFTGHAFVVVSPLGAPSEVRDQAAPIPRSSLMLWAARRPATGWGGRRTQCLFFSRRLKGLQVTHSALTVALL
jgi:hypothetical protein